MRHSNYRSAHVTQEALLESGFHHHDNDVVWIRLGVWIIAIDELCAANGNTERVEQWKLRDK